MASHVLQCNITCIEGVSPRIMSRGFVYGSLFIESRVKY